MINIVHLECKKFTILAALLLAATLRYHTKHRAIFVSRKTRQRIEKQKTVGVVKNSLHANLVNEKYAPGRKLSLKKNPTPARHGHNDAQI